MYRLLIALGMVVCFASCQEKKVKPVPIISFSKAKKLLSSYTGRQDTVLYLHRGFIRLDNTAGQNILISEGVSDPHPLISVYFLKEDTLIFIPVPAVSGTTPQVEEVELELDNTRQLVVWYTRKEKGGAYSFRVALYHFFDGRFRCVLDEQLYYMTFKGQVEQGKVIELGKWKKGVPREVYLLEADVHTGRTQEHLNNGPLLTRKKKGKRQVFKFSEGREKYLDTTEWVEG